jgi:hypothetical protein
LRNCDGFPARCTRKSTPTCSASARRSSTTNVTLLTNARSVKLETDDAGTAVTGSSSSANGAEERSRRRRRPRVRRREHREAPARLGKRPHPNGLANGSDQVGRNYMFHTARRARALARGEPDVFQKTLGLNDFYFGGDDFEYPLGNIQMVGKSQSPMFRGEKPTETKLAPHWTLERDRAARDRLLALDRGPAAAREPGHLDRGRELTLDYKATNDVPKQQLYEKLKSILGKLDMNEATLSTASRT